MATKFISKIAIFAFLTISIISLPSCGGEEVVTPPNQPVATNYLIGSWEISSITSTDGTVDEYFGFGYNFYANSSCLVFAPVASGNHNATWQKTGNALKITYEYYDNFVENGPAIGRVEINYTILENTTSTLKLKLINQSDLLYADGEANYPYEIFGQIETYIKNQ